MNTILIGTVGVLGCALAIAACLSTNGLGGTAASTSEGATGGASSSSTSGATGGASSCPHGTPSPTDGLAVTLTGTLDGATVEDLFQEDNGAYGSGSEAVIYELPKCGGGVFLLDPASAYSPDGGACSPDGAGCDSSHPCCNNNCDGEVCNGSAAYGGLFRMPTPDSDSGQWFCAGSGTASFAPDGSVDFSVSDITRLGACPGKPVSGSVAVCIGIPGSGACSGMDTAITSTLAGASFAWSDPLRNFSAGPLDGPQTELAGEFSVPPETRDGVGSQMLIEYGGLAGLENSDGKVAGGVLRIGSGNPDAGAIYCIGGGTAAQPDGRTYQFTLTTLSRLGTCAGTPVTGSLTGHVNPT